MQKEKRALNCEIDIKEWINKLYSEISRMHKYIAQQRLNIEKADITVPYPPEAINLAELPYETLDLEVLYNKKNEVEGLILTKCSQRLKDEGFFGKQNVSGQSLEKLLKGDGREFYQFILKSFYSKQVVISEYYHKNLGKSYRVIIQPPERDQLQVILQDITREKLHELNLKRYENLFSKAQEISGSGYFQYNIEKQELYITDGVRNIFDCPKPEIMPSMVELKDYLSRVHDDDKEYVLTMISDEKLISNLDFRHRIQVRNHLKHIHIKGSAFYDPMEDSISLIGIVEDITSIQAVENELDKLKKVLSEIEALSHIAYWEYDFMEDNFVGTEEVATILGMKHSCLQISFGDFLNYISETDRKKFYKQYHDSLAKHHDWEGEFSIEDKFSKTKNVRIICYNKFDERGKPEYSRGFICNQTELKQYQVTSHELKTVKSQLSELQEGFKDRLNEELEVIRSQDKYQIQKYKDMAVNDLLSYLSKRWLHSLNVLSTQVHNCMEAYDFGELTQERFHQIHNTIKSQIDEMKKNINKLQQYSDQKGKNIFRLGDVVKELVDDLKPIYQEMGIDLQLELKKDSETVGKKKEFRQSIEEVLKNSQEELVKREIENPRIRILVTQKKGHGIIEIEDNAGGISEGILNRIFEPYYSSPEKSKSSGLGLYISRMVIEKAMNGHLSARNHNSGALFTIKLPFADQESAQ